MAAKAGRETPARDFRYYVESVACVNSSRHQPLQMKRNLFWQTLLITSCLLLASAFAWAGDTSAFASAQGIEGRYPGV